MTLASNEFDSPALAPILSVGERHPALVVVLSGRVSAIDRSDGYDRAILDAGPGQFIGELSLLTGQIAWATCVVQECGEVLIVPADRLRVAIARQCLHDQRGAAPVPRVLIHQSEG